MYVLATFTSLAAELVVSCLPALCGLYHIPFWLASTDLVFTLLILFVVVLVDMLVLDSTLVCSICLTTVMDTL